MSAESDKDDEPIPGNEVGYSPSPPSGAALSPRSEGSPSPSNWTSTQEQCAQEEYDTEMAEYFIYDLTRRFASVLRELALYDCGKCVEELEDLPSSQQRSSWVLAMMGRAHYEKQDYASVRIMCSIAEH